jgi:hypothetical protein
MEALAVCCCKARGYAAQPSDKTSRAADEPHIDWRSRRVPGVGLCWCSWEGASVQPGTAMLHGGSQKEGVNA